MKYKYLLLALVASAFMCVPAQAQDDDLRHEVSISYGAIPNSYWIDLAGNFITAIFGAEYDKVSLVGPIGLEYHYHVSPLIGVGAIATFTHFSEREKNGDVVSKTSNNSHFTLMPSVKFNWLRRDKWGLYSKVAVGATLRHASMKKVKDAADSATSSTTTTNSDENSVFFNFQASLIGVEAGGDHVRGFAELGIGEQGVALAGIRFKF